MTSPQNLAAAATLQWTAYMRPLQTHGKSVGAAYMPSVPLCSSNNTARRGQDPSLQDDDNGCFVGSGLDRSAGWADVSGLARRGGIHAAREPCAAANIPGGINSSPTHCPQTIFCMAGRRGRRPLPPHFVCAQRKLHLFYYLLSFISYLFIICSIRGMIYLTPISITKRSDPF